MAGAAGVEPSSRQDKPRTIGVEPTEMERRKSLTGSEVLSRMRKGDLPTLKGGYSWKAVFEDGAVVSNLVMGRLVKNRKVDPPAHTSVSSPFTLATEQNK